MPGADVSLDDRAYLRQLISCMDVTETHVFFYPRLLPLVRSMTLTSCHFVHHIVGLDGSETNDSYRNVRTSQLECSYVVQAAKRQIFPSTFQMKLETGSLPTAVRDSEERLSKGGVYLLETGLHLFLWVGASVQQELLLNIFGTSSFSQIDSSIVRGNSFHVMFVKPRWPIQQVAPPLSSTFSSIMISLLFVSDMSAGAGQPVLPETPRDAGLFPSAEITIHEGKLPPHLTLTLSSIHVTPRSHLRLPSFAADGSETGRQGRADIQALPGGGQERQRRSVIRGLPVSHAQGDPPASQLGPQSPAFSCMTPLTLPCHLLPFLVERKRFISSFFFFL